MQASVAVGLSPGRRAGRVGPAAFVPAQTPAFETHPNHRKSERRGPRSPRAQATGSRGCNERLLSVQPLDPVVRPSSDGRDLAGRSSGLCDSFVSSCLCGSKRASRWLCAPSVSLCLCGLPGATHPRDLRVRLQLPKGVSDGHSGRPDGGQHSAQQPHEERENESCSQ